jgi:hypothetical protein
MNLVFKGLHFLFSVQDSEGHSNETVYAVFFDSFLSSGINRLCVPIYKRGTVFKLCGPTLALRPKIIMEYIHVNV